MRNKIFIRLDNLNFKPDPSIKHRLLNYLELKSVFSRVRRNSFIPKINLSSILKLPAWKIGIISALFLIIIASNRINNHSTLLINNDSIVNNQAIDTINLSSVNDTVH